MEEEMNRQKAAASSSAGEAAAETNTNAKNEMMKWLKMKKMKN